MLSLYTVCNLTYKVLATFLSEYESSLYNDNLKSALDWWIVDWLNSTTLSYSIAILSESYGHDCGLC